MSSVSGANVSSVCLSLLPSKPTATAAAAAAAAASDAIGDGHDDDGDVDVDVVNVAVCAYIMLCVTCRPEPMFFVSPRLVAAAAQLA
ncbi:hypothetical protein PoB_006975800 [Plakobranchus ocellatus]|uniref:Secreted protein n=1 Tax=Plakobranchus ocellatus TaxID=259542 RepID=A0AAV4DGS2_9GAST|nr:hypothetical protein PoB_006975800 [Plakobranchus ocellatus]